MTGPPYEKRRPGEGGGASMLGLDSQSQSSNLLQLDAGDRRARRELDRLLGQIRAELVAAEAGELVAVHGVFLAASRAVQIVIDHRLDIGAAS